MVSPLEQTSLNQLSNTDSLLDPSTELIILIIVLLFGGGFGYRRYGHRGGIGIGGILLLILILYLIFGHGRV